MLLSQFKAHLNSISKLSFILPNAKHVPDHFHVTEIGQVTKHFIDCGGILRKEKTVCFQLWEAHDVDHRLAPEKLKQIINLSETKLHIEDAEIEVEYQNDTICKYGLTFNANNFILVSLSTACLASDSCGVPHEKVKINMNTLHAKNQNCKPGGDCC